MGIDRLDDADAPVAPRPSGTNDGALVLNPEPITDADRVKFHAIYQAKVDAVLMASARDRWEAARPGFEREWRQYAHDHPAPPVAFLVIAHEARVQVELGCEEIWETEENIVTPAMIRIEAEDPERQLVGLENRCKGEGRIMEKVANWLAAQPDLTPEKALAMVKDPIRYTFQYTDVHYTEGVYADVDRLKAAGFELIELRNSWASDRYKGINSRWDIPGNRGLFEVQFHTEISFEAKQLTHPAYERFRNSSPTDQDELVNFHRRVCAYVPEPRRAREISVFR